MSMFETHMDKDLEVEEIHGTFYTKDHVQVFTIYFENVPEEEKSYDLLHKYFSKFGKIYKLEIEKRYRFFDDEIKISGIVQYDQAESAYSALTYEHKNNFVVLPADSWIQPSILRSNLQTIKEKETKCSLHKLNEDCIMHLLKMLNLRDLIMLTLGFPSFKINIKNFYKYQKQLKIKYKEANDLTLMQIRQFMIENADVIEHLEILDCHFNVKSVRFLNFALRFCKELKSLCISSISFKNKEFSKKFSSDFLKLEKLKLIDCLLDDNDISYLSGLRERIIVLDLSGDNNWFSGGSLHEFQNLKELYLENCEDLRSPYFDKINFSNMEILNINGCCLLDSSFKILSERALKLKSLKMSFSKFDTNNFEIFVGQMKSLTELFINNSSRTTSTTGFYIDIGDFDNRLKTLSESDCLQKKLKVLHLTNYKLNNDSFKYISKFNNLREVMFGFSHEAAIHSNFWTVLECLEKLEVLAIKIDAFKSLETTFIIKVIEFFKSINQNRKSITLKVEISKSVYKEVLENAIYLQSKNLIKVVPFYMTEPYSHHALSEDTNNMS